MRIGQVMKYESLNTPGLWFECVVTCFEGKGGYAIVDCPGVEGRSGAYSIPIKRDRLVAFDPKAKFSAKGGGDDPAGAPALMAEVA